MKLKDSIGRNQWILRAIQGTIQISEVYSEGIASKHLLSSVGFFKENRDILLLHLSFSVSVSLSSFAYIKPVEDLE